MTTVSGHPRVDSLQRAAHTVAFSSGEDDAWQAILWSSSAALRQQCYDSVASAVPTEFSFTPHGNCGTGWFDPLYSYVPWSHAKVNFIVLPGSAERPTD